MNSFKILALAGLLTLGVASQAQINASGYLTYTQSAGVYTYDIWLTNTGTTNIGTLWYAWNPGENYLTVMPTSVMAPTGWTEAVTSAGGSDGFGIKFVNANASSGGGLASGMSLSGFMFNSTMTPTEIGGMSSTYPGANIGDSYIYQGGPFSGQNTQITINPAPEPSSFLALLGVVPFFLRRRRS